MNGEELIAYTKPYLKEHGFKKNNRRWTKNIGEFTLVFFIQGSSLFDGEYYIRPGVFINDEKRETAYYGHIWCELEQTTPEKVMNAFDLFCSTWTNKRNILNVINEYIKREDITDIDENSPVPLQITIGEICLIIPKKIICYVLKNWDN